MTNTEFVFQHIPHKKERMDLNLFDNITGGFFEDDTERQIQQFSSSSCTDKLMKICIILLIITLLLQCSLTVYLKFNRKTNGVKHIRTKATNISTKIEQNVKFNPRFLGKKRTSYLV